MDEAARLREALEGLLDQIGRASLTGLLFEPISSSDLDWYLARLSHLVAPVYLPFAADDIGIMAVHLWPGRTVEASPIVYVSNDGQEAKYICDSLVSLPTGLWLWVGRYFKDKPDELDQAIKTIGTGIPGAKRVPGALWALLQESPEYQPTWWSAKCSEHTERAWQLADVGHPFVGLPRIDMMAEATEALALLEPFVRDHREPELISILVATQLEAGLEPSAEDVLAVLSAEGWRETSCLASGWWCVEGTGMCAWDAVLHHLPNPAQVLGGTPFEGLATKTETYSGEDTDGPLTLASIAQRFRAQGDGENTLIQLRNATTLAILALAKYPKELALAAAESCDILEKDSLAAAVARRSVQIDREAL
jgi:hypothetical protein